MLDWHDQVVGFQSLTQQWLDWCAFNHHMHLMSFQQDHHISVGLFLGLIHNSHFKRNSWIVMQKKHRLHRPAQSQWKTSRRLEPSFRQSGNSLTWYITVVETLVNFYTPNTLMTPCGAAEQQHCGRNKVYRHHSYTHIRSHGHGDSGTNQYGWSTLPWQPRQISFVSFWWSKRNRITEPKKISADPNFQFDHFLWFFPCWDNNQG